MENYNKIMDELEFLRFFYDEVDGALGPASDDVYHIIKEDWKSKGYPLPKEYENEL